jgi:hypothetical protein
MPKHPNTGWNPELENFERLLAGLDSDDFLKLMRNNYQEVRLDPRKLMVVENQGGQGACAGHSLSSIDEWCNAIATGGEMIQLSRAMAYYEAQRISGIRGDQGSTIEAGVKLVTETGLCLESLWMYPRTYNPARPADYQAVLESAKQNRLKQKIRIGSYESFRTFLGSGQGGIHTGISWGNEMNRAVVETFSGGFGGGHSICGLCLSERVDAKGRPYCWIKNSWGHQFGSKVHPGWQEWSPAAIEAMCRHRYTVFVGLSDLDRPEPRKFSLADWKQKLRPYGSYSHAT